MNNISEYEFFLEKLEFPFTNEQIAESLIMLSGEEDPVILEAWYNTILDIAALVPGIGSFAEGINLVSYAKQGEYLLAGLCAIGLIPVFGQYVGAGGSLLIKALRSGGNIGNGILGPLTKLIAKLFPNIVKFLRSSAFIKKFPKITPYIDDMIKALSKFSIKGGDEINKLANSPLLRKGLKGDITKAKSIVKIGDWITPDKKKEEEIPFYPNKYDIQKSMSPHDDWTRYI